MFVDLPNHSPLKVPRSMAWVHVSLLAFIAKCELYLSCVKFRTSTMDNYFKLRLVSLHNYYPFLTLLRSGQLSSSLLPRAFSWWLCLYAHVLSHNLYAPMPYICYHYTLTLRLITYIISFFTVQEWHLLKKLHLIGTC